jgi:hypothetical protein
MAGGEAVRHLLELGYSNVRDYRGGIAEWKENDGPVVAGSVAPAAEVGSQLEVAAPIAEITRPNGDVRRHHWGNALLDLIDRRSTGSLFLIWLAMIVACGTLYWLLTIVDRHGLIEEGAPISTGIRGWLTALYFSFVTATSVGYGDVLPRGLARLLAVVEAVSGLLIFGAVVAKFVSRRQDELMREIHRVTFEERLDRVQTNLHLVISELQSIATLCDDPDARLDRMGSRYESAVLVFAGELRAIHQLLYQPRNAAPEPILEAILVSLASALGTLIELIACTPGGFARSAALDGALTTISELAQDICAECVPQVYAPALTVWMDRIQLTARKVR